MTNKEYPNNYNTDNDSLDVKMRIVTAFLLALGSLAIHSQPLTGIPASDTLGAEDLAGNPTFIGGVANGGGTAHGVW